MREHYLHALSELERQLDLLAKRVEQAIHESMWALEHQSLGFARQVIENDNVIDDSRYTIEQTALNLIARQQPLARDLRVVSAILGLASELERIGDYAEGIAEISIRCEYLPPVELPELIPQMTQHALSMLKEALEALHQRDAEAFERLHQKDDIVDNLYSELTTWAFEIMRENPQTLERATYYLWIGHNLERIADRTINIAEKAAYIATGTLPP